MDRWRDGPSRTVATNGSPSDIVQNCKILLDDAKLTLFEGASRLPEGRLVFHPSNSKLTLYVSAVRWFDRMLHFYPQEFVIRKSKEFIRSIRDHTGVEHPKSTSEACEVIISKPHRCNYRPRCTSKDCAYYHPQHYCKSEVVSTNDGTRVECGQWVHHQLLLHDERLLFQDPPSDLPRFWFKARQQLERDLIILTRSHSTNNAFAVDDALWTIISTIKPSFEIDYVALNFGQWESGQHDNHAQAHAVFTRRGAMNMADRFPVFRGRLDAPATYVFEDCRELEQQRLLFPMVTMLEDDLRCIKTDVREIKDMLATLAANKNKNKEKKKTSKAIKQTYA